jgi:hypothetical protein
MAEAILALTVPARGRNIPLPDAAALHHEWSAALFIWAALPAGSAKRAKVCRQLLELRGRLDACVSSIAEEVHYGYATFRVAS